MLVQSLTKLKNGPKVGTRPCKFSQALLGLITPAVNGGGGKVVMRFSLLKAAERVAPGFNNKEGRRGEPEGGIRGYSPSCIPGGSLPVQLSC